MSALKRESELLGVLAFYAAPGNYAHTAREDGEGLNAPAVTQDKGQRARDAIAMVDEATR